MSDNSGDTTKLWGGRFTESTDEFVERFTASVSFDYRLYPYDIEGSIAHARMLQKPAYLPQQTLQKLLKAWKASAQILKGETSIGRLHWKMST